jgi:hypothetical protein
MTRLPRQRLTLQAGIFIQATCRPSFPIRLQRFNRLGLGNPISENQPSLSRRSKLFAMPPVAYGLSHFAFGDFPAFGCGQ